MFTSTSLYSVPIITIKKLAKNYLWNGGSQLSRQSRCGSCFGGRPIWICSTAWPGIVRFWGKKMIAHCTRSPLIPINILWMVCVCVAVDWAAVCWNRAHVPQSKPHWTHDYFERRRTTRASRSRCGGALLSCAKRISMNESSLFASS